MSAPIPAEVIAEALAKHRFREPERICSCGVLCGVVCDGLTYAEHLASVIAALPDIAIVSLPEGESNWHIMDWDGGRVSLCHGVDTVRCYLPNPELEVKAAERLGIALIAASRSLAAGGES